MEEVIFIMSGCYRGELFEIGARMPKRMVKTQKIFNHIFRMSLRPIFSSKTNAVGRQPTLTMG
jgi:hypothetical protein